MHIHLTKLESAGDLTGHMLDDHTIDPNENTHIAAQPRVRWRSWRRS